MLGGIIIFIVFTSDTSNLLPLNKEIVLSSVNGVLAQLNQTLLDNDESATIHYEILSEKKEFVFEADETLPQVRFSLYQSIENGLGDSLTIEQEVFLETLQEAFEQSSKPKKSKRPLEINKSIKKYIVPVALGLMILLLSTKVNQQEKEIAELATQESTVEVEELSATKIDTFSRYFLSNYFSEGKNKETYQETLKPYVSEKSLSEFEGTTYQLKSSLLWQIEKKDQQYNVSYIVSLKENDQSTTKKISLVLKEGQKNEYKLAELPKLEDYTIKLTLQEE